MAGGIYWQICKGKVSVHDYVPRDLCHIGERSYKSSRWKWVVCFTLCPLFRLGKSPLYPLNKRLVGFQSRSRLFGERKRLYPLPGRISRFVSPYLSRCFKWISLPPLCYMVTFVVSTLIEHVINPSTSSGYFTYFTYCTISFNIKSSTPFPQGGFTCPIWFVQYTDYIFLYEIDLFFFRPIRRIAKSHY